MDTLQSRRSIRKYSSKDVSNHLLYQLLERAERTQTMGNLQLYSVVITRDTEQKKLLSPAHFHQPMVMQAPVVLTFCADFNRTTQWANNRQANPSYNNFLSFVNAASDALLYCQTFCQLAEEAGLGLCYLGTTLYNPQPIIDVLQLPTLVMPIATITLGYPDESVEQSERLPLQAIVHQETYQPYDVQRINECYAEKEGLEVNKNFVATNKKETLAQVFTDIRYTKEGNEMFSKHLLDALKKQHFLD
jgi:putative nitroreductase family protein